MGTDHNRRRRPTSPAAGEVAFCPCGSAWFQLRPGPSNDDLEQGALSVDGNGSVIAYAGNLHCQQCGTPFSPGTCHLRAVE